MLTASCIVPEMPIATLKRNVPDHATRKYFDQTEYKGILPLDFWGGLTSSIVSSRMKSDRSLISPPYRQAGNFRGDTEEVRSMITADAYSRVKADPRLEAEDYDDVVKRIVKSFRPGDLSSLHTP